MIAPKGDATMLGGAQVGNVSDEVHAVVERAELTELTRVEGQTFMKQRVILDGSYWANCRFVKCEVAVVLGAFRVDSETRFEDCKIRYNGSAGRVYDLITATRGQSRRAGQNT